LWNTHSLPVVGVDINENMMRHALQQHRLAEYHARSDLADTRLPDKSFDIIIMSETLEHLLDPPRVLAEVRRILKDDGVFLITVPYDIFLGPFFVLFNINCLYQGYVKGSIYHRYRCGHVNHFTKRRLREVLKESGWRVERIDVVNGLSLYAAARKA
jgi:ubiquinone/menaquinone biosynthesis C-methylase UbiE